MDNCLFQLRFHVFCWLGNTLRILYILNIHVHNRLYVHRLCVLRIHSKHDVLLVISVHIMEDGGNLHNYPIPLCMNVVGLCLSSNGHGIPW